jgi:hypothetical protein
MTRVDDVAGGVCVRPRRQGVVHVVHVGEDDGGAQQRGVLHLPLQLVDRRHAHVVHARARAEALEDGRHVLARGVLDVGVEDGACVARQQGLHSSTSWLN